LDSEEHGAVAPQASRNLSLTDTLMSGIYPLFVNVSDVENGLRGSVGSETDGVILGKKASPAAIPPIKVAAPSNSPAGEGNLLVLSAFCRTVFGLDRFGPLFDLAFAPITVFAL